MDVLIALPILLGLTLPFLLKGMWRWVGLILLIVVYEGILALSTGQTLSQEFWRHFEWRLIWLLAGAWMLLLVHLAWKRLRRKA